jgi:putative transcriptional regulator
MDHERIYLRRIVGIVLAAVAALGLIALGARYAYAQDKPALLVAAPALQGMYRGTVLLAAPFPSGGHVGVILNRPSKSSMAELFPDHPPSAAVTDPVYFGGPVNQSAISALTRAESAPHPRSIELAPGVWLVINAVTIDSIIESTPNAARYYVGFVVWRPGELAEELRRGYFVLRPVDQAKLFLKDTGQLWDELSTKKGQVGT